MLNIGFFKGQPTEYVIKFVAGKMAREGPGLAFYYFQHKTQIVVVPTSSTDANFVFNEVTNNFQSVTIQGQLTYRIHNPRQAAALLNFTLDPRLRAYVSNDPERLSQRITNIIQMETRGQLQKRTLEETLGQFEAIATTVQARVKEGALLEPLGVELLSVYFVSAKPTPEVAKALEVEYRESLLRRADEAIYARRAAAVEEERKIKENELHTEITLEERRRQLIDLQGDNARREAENRGQALEKEAEYRARAKEMELAVYKSMDARSILALGLNDLAQNAERIANLTITSEILGAILNGHTPPTTE
jgi:hypothetical protein